jgi:hypothetical protein
MKEAEDDSEHVIAAAAAAVAVDVSFDEDSKLPPNALASKVLTQERKDKLDALGFVWNLRSKRVDDHWDEMFSQVRQSLANPVSTLVRRLSAYRLQIIQLQEYKQQHGDCLVSSLGVSYSVHCGRLVVWVSHCFLLRYRADTNKTPSLESGSKRRYVNSCCMPVC